MNRVFKRGAIGRLFAIRRALNGIDNQPARERLVQVNRLILDIRVERLDTCVMPEDPPVYAFVTYG